MNQGKNGKKNISASVCEGKRNKSNFVSKTRWDTARCVRNKVGLAAKFPEIKMERGRTCYLSSSLCLPPSLEIGEKLAAADLFGGRLAALLNRGH